MSVSDDTYQSINDQCTTTIPSSSLYTLTDDRTRDIISNGRVLIEISMCEEEITSHRQPSPLYCHPLRIEYLVDLYSVIKDHFLTFIPPLIGQQSTSNSETDRTLWFDIIIPTSREGGKAAAIPLNWSTPIGVLFDLYGPCVTEGIPAPTPWKIIVHFMYYPPPQSLLEFKTYEQFSSIHFNQMKAALAIQLPKHAPTAFGLMLTADVERLRRRDPRILSKCIDSKELRNAKVTTLNDISHVALKVYNQDSTSPLLYSMSPYSTISDLITEIDASKSCIVIIHGIHVNPDTPLWWLMLHTFYTDLFLHIVIRLPE